MHLKMNRWIYFWCRLLEMVFFSSIFQKIRHRSNKDRITKCKCVMTMASAIHLVKVILWPHVPTLSSFKSDRCGFTQRWLLIDPNKNSKINDQRKIKWFLFESDAICNLNDKSLAYPLQSKYFFFSHQTLAVYKYINILLLHFYAMMELFRILFIDTRFHLCMDLAKKKKQRH